MIQLLSFPLPFKESPLVLVDTAIRISGADMGNYQSYDPKTQSLTIQAQRGFEKPFLDYFARIHHGQGACAESMHTLQQVIVENVLEHPIFKATPMLPVMLAAGARACISTPIIDMSGRLQGIFSTHFHKKFCPDKTHLQSLQNLANWFANRS